MMTIEQHGHVHVLRDDLLPGGTKSLLLDKLVQPGIKEYVYASPVYGGFQIALSLYCRTHGYKATIFCAKRNGHHANTRKCIEYGAQVIEVPYGYLTNVEKHARIYAEEKGAVKLAFGAKSPESIQTIADRMREATAMIGFEPQNIWCAVGSGTLIDGILQGTDHSRVHGVVVGAEYNPGNYRALLYKYPRPFADQSRVLAPFPSMPNYDLKAWEYCRMYSQVQPKCFFWNVL